MSLATKEIKITDDMKDEINKTVHAGNVTWVIQEDFFRYIDIFSVSSA